jgi:MFS family permease
MTVTAEHVGSPVAASRRAGAILAILLIGQFMAILDVSIVNVAAPTIRADLDLSGGGLQLVVAGYTISYAVLLITGARLGDRLGHGRVFQVGLALFTLASLACGLAPTGPALIVFRVVQGVGAAAMMPQVMSLIQRSFTGGARARALSLYSAVIACGAVVGQVFGGVIVSADLFGTGWRPVFLVNVPIGLLLLGAARRTLPVDRGDPDRRMDPSGVVTLSAAVLLFVVPLVLGHQEGWPTWCWVSLAASAAVLALFVSVERGLAARGGSPLVSAAVLRAPGMAVGCAALLLALVTYGGFLFITALHLQSGLGDSPLRAGLTFAPAAIGFAATGLTWRLLPQRWHAPIIPGGLLAAAALYLALGLVLRDGSPAGATAELILLLLGMALGLAFSPMITVTLSHVPLSAAADASGVLVTVFQLGQVVGVATMGTLYLSLVNAGGAVSSGHAYAWTSAAIAACALVAAGFAATVVRPRSAV